jgi:thiazole tautomerase (transcriptional regulator TenI)
MKDFPVVHVVSDSSVIVTTGFVERATAIMKALGPRGALHLRSSRASGRKFYDLAVALAKIQEASGCWLIVNDRIDVARAVGARGAQLASHSMLIPDARRVAPGTPIGSSVHSVEEAIEAEGQGASWCVAGTVFETPSHEGRPAARVEFVQEVARAVKIPVIAIGGVRPEDVGALRDAGAYGVATIRGAGWQHGREASVEGGEVHLTRLALPRDEAFLEPVKHYISAYDSWTGRERDNHPDGERLPPGAGSQ